MLGILIDIDKLTTRLARSIDRRFRSRVFGMEMDELDCYDSFRSCVDSMFMHERDLRTHHFTSQSGKDEKRNWRRQMVLSV